MNNNYVIIGKVVNIFGIKGELKITSNSDFIDYRYQVGKTIYFKKANKLVKATVSSYRLIKGNPTIRINNEINPDNVMEYIGCEVYADSSDKPELEEGTYYIDDLVGLDVICEDKVIGKVNDVIKLPKNSCLEIILNDGSTTLMPLIPDYVVKVNKDSIIVNKMEVI